MADKQHILTGTTAPASVPPGLGAHYINTATGDHYLASGAASADDWGLPVYTGEPPTPEPGGGGGNGVEYTTEGQVPSDDDAHNVPAGQRLVEIDMSEDYESMRLVLPPIGDEPNHELLVIVSRPRESAAPTLIIPGPIDQAGFETYVTVVPGTLGESNDGTNSGTSWSIPLPVGYSVLRIFRRWGRVIVVASLAA